MGYVIFMFEFKKKHIFSASMQKKENPNSSKLLFQNDGLYIEIYKKIIISPRNKEIAKRLKKKFNTIKIAKNNQEVLNLCSWTFLSITPNDGEKIIKNLKFNPNQTVISFISTITVAQLKKMIKVKAKIVRAIPYHQYL